MNDRVPFDVLINIFDYYRESEHPGSPLETLLLVCREWNEAATNYHNLWCHLNINLGHGSSLEIWKARLPLRLQRSGTNAPLFITFRNVWAGDRFDFGSTACQRCIYPRYGQVRASCLSLVLSSTRWFLDTLAGTEGEYRKRWKTMDLKLGFNGFHSSEYADSLSVYALTLPTPSLSRLSITNTRVIGSSRIFPEAGSLKEVVLRDYIASDLPDISAARTILVELSREVYDRSSIIGLGEAADVEEVSIDIPGPQKLTFPPRMLSLKGLILMGPGLPSNLSQLYAPNLTKLCLQFLPKDSITGLTRYRNFPFGQIEELEFFSELGYSSIEQVIEAMLLSMHSLKYILGNTWIITFVVRLLRKHNDTTTASRRFLGTSDVILTLGVKERRIPWKVEERDQALKLLVNDWHLNE